MPATMAPISTIAPSGSTRIVKIPPLQDRADDPEHEQKDSNDVQPHTAGLPAPRPDKLPAGCACRLRERRERRSFAHRHLDSGTVLLWPKEWSPIASVAAEASLRRRKHLYAISPSAAAAGGGAGPHRSSTRRARRGRDRAAASIRTAILDAVANREWKSIRTAPGARRSLRRAARQSPRASARAVSENRATPGRAKTMARAIRNHRSGSA